MSPSAISGRVSPLTHQPSIVARQPEPQTPLDLALLGLGEASLERPLLHPDAEIHQLQGLSRALLQRRAPSTIEIVPTERVERRGHVS
jgi:hypothetical protein